jgi:hypothetical protein
LRIKVKVGTVIRFEEGDLPSLGPANQDEPSYLVISKVEHKGKRTKVYGPWIGSYEIDASPDEFGPFDFGRLATPDELRIVIRFIFTAKKITR